MIGHLSGTLGEIDGNELLVSVGGVGYLVAVSDVTQYQVGHEISLYVYTNVKEDEISLFGFASVSDKKIFKLLISVSGIGAKSALAILSHGNSAQIRQAIVKADVAFFQAISGIGKKTAQRIIIDLKSKVGSVAEIDLSEPVPGTNDVYDALVGMGFSPQKVHQVIKEIESTLPEQEQIKTAIKQLSA